MTVSLWCDHSCHTLRLRSKHEDERIKARGFWLQAAGCESSLGTRRSEPGARRLEPEARMGSVSWRRARGQTAKNLLSGLPGEGRAGTTRRSGTDDRLSTVPCPPAHSVLSLLSCRVREPSEGSDPCADPVRLALRAREPPAAATPEGRTSCRAGQAYVGVGRVYAAGPQGADRGAAGVAVGRSGGERDRRAHRRSTVRARRSHSSGGTATPGVVDPLRCKPVENGFTAAIIENCTLNIGN
jgi:hypothetical protein